MINHARAAIALAALVAALGAASVWLDRSSHVEAAAVQAPRFEVDPMWPKPLPNHWIMGNIIGVYMDAKESCGSSIVPR